MILQEFRIKNFRSIKDTGDFPLRRMLALIGENNCGKSNIMAAIERFVTGGAAGTTEEDFNEPSSPIVIKATFGDLSSSEQRRWQSYLVNGRLILEKHLSLEDDGQSAKRKVKGDYHGYRAEPTDWFLSLTKIAEREGQRPNWKNIVEQNNLPGYFLQDGSCNKTVFSKALLRYLSENSVPHDVPDLSQTHALGLESNVVATLPKVYFLKAITDYNDEIDKRTSNTTFRRLMGDLSERIIKKDPDYAKIEQSLQQVKHLLNRATLGGVTRLQSLTTIEDRITELLKRLMPLVSGVSLKVEVDDISDIFSKGIAVSVHDGVETDVLTKGHGLQRCIVFALLQALILNERGQLSASDDQPIEIAPIILAIEEPELYIHPQLAKLFYDVMQQFATTDQVIYATHSPLFVDAFNHDNIALVRKTSPEIGTKVISCDASAFTDLADETLFQGLTRLNPAVNELFFARRVLVVEGPEDQIAVTSYLCHEGKIHNRVEELDWSIIVAGGKDAIPFFQRVLNAFTIPYKVLHDLDIVVGMKEDDCNTHKKVNEMIAKLASSNQVVTFPVKMETSLGLTSHLRDQYKAHQFFQRPENMTKAFKDVVGTLFN